MILKSVKDEVLVEVEDNDTDALFEVALHLFRSDDPAINAGMEYIGDNFNVSPMVAAFTLAVMIVDGLKMSKVEGYVDLDDVGDFVENITEFFAKFPEEQLETIKKMVIR